MYEPNDKLSPVTLGRYVHATTNSMQAAVHTKLEATKGTKARGKGRCSRPVQHPAGGKQHQPVGYWRNCNRVIWEREQLELPAMTGLPISVQVKDSSHPPPIYLLIAVVVQGKTSSIPFTTKWTGPMVTRSDSMARVVCCDSMRCRQLCFFAFFVALSRNHSHH